MLRRDPRNRVVALLSTLSREFGRVAMHGVRRELLRAQARSAGVPLWELELPRPCPNETYERLMAGMMRRAVEEGVTHVAFGDLFLEDVRAYRERTLAGTGLEPLFPLWGRDTGELVREMLAAGLRAVVTCVDPGQVPAELAGRDLDADLLAELPAGADPCGENGELHTFAWKGPMFREPVPVRRGEVVTREGFVFADLVRAGGDGEADPTTPTSSTT